jgi:hypothetical protein
MPYLGGDETDRFAAKAGGLAMTAGEFVLHAESVRQRRDELSASPAPDGTGSARARRDLGRFAEELSSQQEGGRAKLLYGRAKDMGRMIGAGWIGEDDVFAALLRAGTTCGLSMGEASDHIRNGIREGKSLPPREEPEGDRYPQIEKIAILRGGEETMWIVTVAGHGELTLPVKEVVHYWTFNLRCADQLRVSFRQMKADAWNDRLDAALRHAEERQVPPDETMEGMFFDELRDFCTDRSYGTVVDELLTGRPVHIKEEDRIYFRFKDFETFLARRASGAFRSASISRLGRLMTSIGTDKVDVGKTTKKLKGRTTEVRWVRLSMFEEMEPLDLPPLSVDPLC